MIDIESKILQRRKQVLVHCYLYYKMDESIISDLEYEKFCNELMQLQKEHPYIAKTVKHDEIFSKFDTSVSGFNIEYPIEIISDALKLLAYHKNENLQDIAAKHGMRLLGKDEVIVKGKSKRK